MPCSASSSPGWSTSGPIPNARDASRVLRLVATCNTKQPDPELRKVRVLWVEEADGAPLLYDFDRLADTVLPFTREEAAAAEAEKPSGRIIPFKQGGEADRQARRFSYETLHWDRVTDMRRLRVLRGAITEHGRETFVFLMLNELAKSGQVNAHNFPYETVALAVSAIPSSRVATGPGAPQHPLPPRQGTYGRSARQVARSVPLQERDADREAGNHARRRTPHEDADLDHGEVPALE